MMTVHVAETLFRWLMRAYPARFRRAHGLALFELFRDEARALNEHPTRSTGRIKDAAVIGLDDLDE